MSVQHRDKGTFPGDNPVRTAWYSGNAGRVHGTGRAGASLFTLRFLSGGINPACQGGDRYNLPVAPAFRVATFARQERAATPTVARPVFPPTNADSISLVSSPAKNAVSERGMV